MDGTQKAALRQKYDMKVPALRQLQEEATFILEHSLAKSGLKYHSLTSRIKTFESFFTKAERMRSPNPLEIIHDLVGLRIVCLFLSDIEKVAKLIRECFHVLEEDDKIEGQEIASFGYMSFHFKVEMKPSYVGPRYDAIAKLSLEIQVRTIAMDAWAATSHYLDYKSDSDVPSDLRRDFYALSGLFYVADKHFEMFFKSRQIVRDKIEKTFERKNPLLEQELNLDSLTSYLRSKFPTRTQPTPQDVSILVSELLPHDYTTIIKLDEMVQEHWKWFLAREKSNPPSRRGKPIPFAAVGVVRIILHERVVGEEEEEEEEDS